MCRENHEGNEGHGDISAFYIIIHYTILHYIIIHYNKFEYIIIYYNTLYIIYIQFDGAHRRPMDAIFKTYILWGFPYCRKRCVVDFNSLLAGQLPRSVSACQQPSLFQKI